MSQKQTTGDTVSYLQSMLELNPIISSSEIMNRRAYHLGIRKPVKPVSESELQQRRNRAEDQINRLRKDFWTTNPGKLQNELKAINVKDFPDLQPAVDRIKLVSSFRSEFDSLGTHPAKVDNLFLAMKRLVIVSPSKAGSIKESYLRRVADGANLKEIQKMVSVVKKEFPNLYRLESDFLDSISRVKGRYVAPDSGGGPAIDFEIPGWLIGICVFLAIRILLAVLMRM